MALNWHMVSFHTVRAGAGLTLIPNCITGPEDLVTAWEHCLAAPLARVIKTTKYHIPNTHNPAGGVVTEVHRVKPWAMLASENLKWLS